MRVQIQNDVVVAWGIALDLNSVDVFEQGVPDDYSIDKYNYAPLSAGVYNPNGFTIKASPVEIDFDTLSARSEAMYEYMLGQLGQTAAFRTFCADVDALNTQYISGSLALIAFIRTVNDTIWGNYSTTGFTTKTTYRGTAVGGVYTRQTAILAILQPAS